MICDLIMEELLLCKEVVGLMRNNSTKRCTCSYDTLLQWLRCEVSWSNDNTSFWIFVAFPRCWALRHILIWWSWHLLKVTNLGWAEVSVMASFKEAVLITTIQFVAWLNILLSFFIFWSGKQGIIGGTFLHSTSVEVPWPNNNCSLFISITFGLGILISFSDSC